MKGRCFCSKVEYSLEATPITTNCCHCRNCQKLSGSAFAINIKIEAAAVKVISATQPIEKVEGRADKPSSGSRSSHCPDCGIMLWATVGFLGDGLIFVRAGTLDQSENIVPDTHFFTRSKHSWIQIPAGTPSFDTFPGENDAPLWIGEAKDRVEAATSQHHRAR